MARTSSVPVAQEFSSVKLVVVDVPSPTVDVFRACFEDVKVSIQPTTVGDSQSIKAQRFDACIMTLASPGAAKVLSAMRRSEASKHCVVYAIGASEEAIQLSRYGINALIEQPTAPRILSAVRETYLLLVHRLRRHVRVPFVTAVTVQLNGHRLNGISRDVSAGGLNISAETEAAVGHPVVVAFTLPQAARFRLEGVICWKADRQFGVALFNSSKQAKLQKWVDDYLLVFERSYLPAQT